MSWFGRTFASSLGKKYVMALTGILLVGFLFAHLAGNLLIFKSDEGAAFDEYARGYETNPLLPLAEIGLAALFIAHIALALRVSAQNRDARSQRYSVRASMGAKTVSSSSMLVTGVIVLLFLLVHLWDFRVGKLSHEEGTSLASLVRGRLGNPVGAAIYLVGVVALGFHLRHAFRSAFQTLGVNHPNVNALLARASIAIAILLGLGFAAFPIFFLASGGGR